MTKEASGGLKRFFNILLIVVGSIVLIVGLMASFGIFGKIFPDASGSFEKAVTSLEDANAWVRAGIMLAGLIMISVVLNSIDTGSKGSSRLNSKLIRRPIQRSFPLFLLPVFCAFCIGFLYPFVKGLFLSFCTFKTTNKWEWSGFTNYINAFKDGTFVHAFLFTALFTIVSMILINVFAFAVAYVLTRGIRGSNLFRTVFFMPNLIGGIVLGYIWSMIFDGILVNINTSVVLQTKYGFWGLIIMMCWQQIGYIMIIYIAGLQSISEDILEAAKIDGAKKWKTLWHIIIPNMMPSITICTFLTLTNSFKLYDQNLALTNGRPFEQLADGSVIKTTEMLALNIVNSFYSSVNTRGLGQAKAVVFFILVATISIIQLRMTHKKELQQ